MPYMIRDWQPEDRETYIALSQAFYRTDAVQHTIPEQHFSDTFAQAISGSPYVRGLSLCHNDEMVGFAQLSLTWSNEAGGLCVLVEELYILPEHQGHGLGGKCLDFISKEYAGKARRLRLEVTESNKRAAELYRKKGYNPLDYLQMINDR